MTGSEVDLNLKYYDELSPELKQMFRERDLNFHWRLWYQCSILINDDPVEQVNAYQEVWRKIEFDLLVQSWKKNK